MNAALERARQYVLLMRLHRPIGIFLLLWPTLWALWIAASGTPDTKVLTVFVLGVILMRSAGCVINDYADRKVDPHIRRTRDRPLASGRVSSREALTLFIILCLTAFGLVLLTNPLTVMLSLIGAALAASYPFMKRYTHLPQVHLGVAFGWAVPMAFTAQTGELPPPIAWVLLLVVILWAVAYDTMYAMVDREDDLRIGVKSTAILFADADRAVVAMLQGAVLVLLTATGVILGLGPTYYLGVTTGAGLMFYQQRLIRERDPQQCFKAFQNNGWFGALVFFGIAASYAQGA